MLKPLRSFVRFYSPRISRPIRRTNLAEEPFELSRSLTSILDEPALVIERQLEMGSIIFGFEQGRVFRLYRPDGAHLGYLQESQLGIGQAIMRQVTRLHRPFSVDLFDNYNNRLLTFKRPFSFINSKVSCYLPDQTIIGESQQEWHLWRRRYNLFMANRSKKEFDQFGRIDAPFLSFEFPIQDEQEQIIGSIDRNFSGIGRELFTDTGVYVLRFSPEIGGETLSDQAKTEYIRNMPLVQRTMMLGTAISVDFDYFSRHSNHGVGPFTYTDI